MQGNSNKPQSQGAQGSDFPRVLGEVQRLIDKGKCKQAVELAKDEHKRRPTAESEALLVNAYLCRIRQFQEKGQTQDAQVLLKLVEERFPSFRARLIGLQADASAAEGNIDRLVAPLVQPGVSDEVQKGVEAAIQKELVDLSALANTTVLPADHPLKTAASAAWRAFQAVTSGPVTDDQIALNEISRRSPLAGWKLLIRAIAAFYRQDDEAAKRTLDAIDREDAVWRLVPAMTAMISRQPGKTPKAVALQSSVKMNETTLYDALAAVDRALSSYSERQLNRAVEQALALCDKEAPEYREKLLQHLSVLTFATDVPEPRIFEDDPSPRLKNAYYWRLLARASEEGPNRAQAALFWERFAAHAVAEGMFAPDSLEAATVYFRAAQVLARVPPRLVWRDKEMYRSRQLLRLMYANQAPHIQALAPQADQQTLNNVFDSNWYFRRAADIDPSQQVFRTWYALMCHDRIPWRELQNVGEEWHKRLPNDPEPLLLLTMQAEERGALAQALKYLTAAEAIDALNPLARRARLRLTLGTALRHLKDKKPHLLEKDLAQLETLPLMQDADRPALLDALRAAWRAQRREKDLARQSPDAIVARMGPLAADPLLNAVAAAGKMDPQDPSWPAPQKEEKHPDSLAVSHAAARLVQIDHDLHLLSLTLPKKWIGLIQKELRKSPSRLSHDEMIALARHALVVNNERLAYEITTAALAGAAGPVAAKILLLRADAMLGAWADRRVSQCLRAAFDLARQSHDTELMNRVSEAIDRHPRTHWAMSSSTGGGSALGAELLAEIIKKEREAVTYPSYNGGEQYVVIIDKEPPFGMPFPFYNQGGGDGDEYDDNEDEYAGSTPFDIEDIGEEGYEDEYGGDFDGGEFEEGGFDPEDLDDEDLNAFDFGTTDLFGSQDAGAALPPGAIPGKSLAALTSMSPDALRELMQLLQGLDHPPTLEELQRLSPKAAKELEKLAAKLQNDPQAMKDIFGLGGIPGMAPPDDMAPPNDRKGRRRKRRRR